MLFGRNLVRLKNLIGIKQLTWLGKLGEQIQVSERFSRPAGYSDKNENLKLISFQKKNSNSNWDDFANSVCLFCFFSCWKVCGCLSNEWKYIILYRSMSDYWIVPTMLFSPTQTVMGLENCTPSHIQLRVSYGRQLYQRKMFRSVWSAICLSAGLLDLRSNRLATAGRSSCQLHSSPCFVPATKWKRIFFFSLSVY